MKILFLTVLKVFKREGISAEGHATMPSFVDWAKVNGRIPRGSKVEESETGLWPQRAQGSQGIQ